ncbi:sensor histidine kinase [Zestomonas carbonaria]|uniref:histidine kinase n=1 Tax=Zestomonas carbonaria TaxID=2762745 RepID=A0A7U7IAJ6_9GAMM|nr:HAMP domain-containing sensor histidine kinase [Pseudomonas carbonaria]CAD5109524.1 Adaptive-response sensory-kinase SasA [Pseudomonas carbonaria]
MSAPSRWRIWPRTLASRLSLIFLVGLLLAHGLSFGLLFFERYQSAESMMLGNLERDVQTAVAILDRLPAEERPAWLDQLERRTYRFVLGPGDDGEPLDAGNDNDVVRAINSVIGQHYRPSFSDIGGVTPHLQAHLFLADGSPLTIDVRPSVMPMADWLPVVLLAQLAVLLGCTWLAVRTATRPLARLARAADTLDPNMRGPRLDEDGPSEVAYAATAFNAMQDRIAAHLEERLQILAAISHDLQTPITRMKLRVEFMDDAAGRDKWEQDLGEMERLVHEGVAYARSVHGAVEKPGRVDLDAFLASLVYDYQDTGQKVSLEGRLDIPLNTRPHALRRILGNLIDNALKFSGAAEVRVRAESESSLSIEVLDRGPGIAEEELTAVLQPFYRLETSRNRGTGGTGLGLAIAQQLALAIGGSLTLANREGGGLVARLQLRR